MDRRLAVYEPYLGVMPTWKVPLADVVVSDDDIAAVAETYRSGWLSMGPQTDAFESALAAYTGAEHALAVTNGTAALHLICEAAGLKAGDEVVVPSLTFVATVNAVAYTGATPVFADIAGLDRPWLSAASAAAAVTDRTKAIMTMSYGGHPGEVQALKALCDERGLLLLEDAAHGIGGRSGDLHLGRTGAAGAFSFFSNKNLAIGEGGAIVTDDDELAARMRLLRSHGMTTLSWDRHRGHATGYDVVALGFNYRIDEPRAALASRRLARLDAETVQRAAIAARYRELLAATARLVPALPDVTGEQPAHHLFVVVLDADIDRAAFRAALAAQGIQTSMHYPPVHHFSMYRDAPRGPLPETDAYGARTVTLPLFAHMTEAQQDLVLAAVNSALR